MLALAQITRTSKYRKNALFTAEDIVALAVAVGVIDGGVSSAWGALVYVSI